MDIDFKKIKDIEFDGIDPVDYPDYCDTYISAATYEGEPMTEGQLDEINMDGCFVHSQLMIFLY